MDWSFLKLYTSIEDSLDIGDYKNTQLGYATSIQLSPNETYSQMTNVDGGIAFDSNYSSAVVDSCDNVLLDITDNVFFEQFVDVNGDTQMNIEIVNIGQEFYGRAVHIRFKNDAGSDKWYTRPIKITDRKILNTIRFDYTNVTNMEGLSYQASEFTQSIRLYCEYSKPDNQSEVGKYYQISSKNTISTRFLRKKADEYKLLTVDPFTLDRLQKIMEHDTIYLDGVRVTDNPIVTNGERIGYTNLVPATFVAFRNQDDTFSYSFQIFEGLSPQYYPNGNYVLSGLPSDGTITYSIDVTLQTGTITIYDASDNSVVSTFTEADMSVTDNVLTITGFTDDIIANGTYYVHVTAGLVIGLGIESDVVEDDSTWVIIAQDGDYDADDYSSDDYLTD